MHVHFGRRQSYLHNVQSPVLDYSDLHHLLFKRELRSKGLFVCIFLKSIFIIVCLYAYTVQREGPYLEKQNKTFRVVGK